LSDPTPPAPTLLLQKTSKTGPVQEDSEWDSSVVSGAISPRPGILKTGILVKKGDDVWDSTVEMATPRGTHSTYYSEVNVVKTTEVPKSDREIHQQDHVFDDVIPAPLIAAVVEGGMLAPDEEGEDESESDWDSKTDELPPDAGAAHVFTASGSPTSAGRPQPKPKAVDSHLQSHEIQDPDLDSDEDTETMSSWEKERKVSHRIDRLQKEEVDKKAGITRVQREEVERQAEMNRLQREDIQRQAEVDRLHKEERERQAEVDLKFQREKVERQTEIDRLQKAEEERQAEMDRLQREEIERQVEIDRLQREELERKVQLDMIIQRENTLQHEEMERHWTEEIDLHEDIDREWKVDEAEMQERLRSEMDGFFQEPESPTDTVDSVFFQQQELARIDEQFQKERAEREKKEEEVNRYKRVEEEARQFKEKQEENKNYQENLPAMLKSAPPNLPSQTSLPLRTQVGPSMSGVYANVGSSAIQELKQRLQVIPPTPVPAVAPLYSELDDDESLQSDTPGEERPSMPKYYHPANSFYRPHDPLDDDALSYTSTEFEDHMQSTAAYGRERDILTNINISDASSLLKVQEYVRETRSGLEHERNQRVVLENKLRLSNKEKDEIVQKLESLSQQKSTLEQTKLELEAKIRTLEYNVTEEAEKCKNMEILLTKTKEQLARKEAQFS
ncbi:unnamed protein product, partial [Candidula unifasciata]